MHPAVADLLRFFEFDHLPDGPLRRASARFHALAHEIVQETPSGAELTAGLRKLLEAKDCVVRATLPRREVEQP